MGWLILAILMLVALAVLRLAGVRGPMLTLSASALLVGAAGYAFQGQPNLPGSPPSSIDREQIAPLTEARHAFYGNFSGAEGWLTMAEALERTGKTEDAASLLQNAVRRHPGDAQLWIGLGNILVDHSGGLTPPAQFAYKRAAALDPLQPAPGFFYGVALARSGDPAAAVAIWKQILADAPANASWRPLIEQGVAALSNDRRQAATGK